MSRQPAYGRNGAEIPPTEDQGVLRRILWLIAGCSMARVRSAALAGAAAGAAVLLIALPSGASAQDDCPNADKRWGPSQDLPDCRAYELVTPRDTNGQTPWAGIGRHRAPAGGAGGGASQGVTTPAVSADGTLLQYMLMGTSLEGPGGNGFLGAYIAERSADGWTSTYTGPDPTIVDTGVPGGASHDFSYQSYVVQQDTVIRDWPSFSVWMKQPNGVFRPNGEGTVPAVPDTDIFSNNFQDDPFSQQVYITPSGDHQIIWSRHIVPGSPKIPLTMDAPAPPTDAVYDRTRHGLNLVSVLPDGSTPTRDGTFQGASTDGTVIAFTVGSVDTGADLYVRINNETTKHITAGDFTSVEADQDQFGWLTNDTIIFRRDGDLFANNFIGEEETQITSTGDARLIRVSEDGRKVFFLSSAQLDGANGVAGEPNLYVWNGSGTQFIATTRDADNFVTGACAACNNRGGLDQWASDTNGREPASRNEGNLSTTRALADGSVFVFTSSANITGQNPGLHFQIYRWEADSGDVTCVSCPVDGSDTTAPAILNDGWIFAGTAVDIPNLTNDGETVFFETQQKLVPRDNDGVWSVYQWRDGEISLLSSGNSERGDHIVGASPDGSQVFINTTDTLVAEPQEDGIPAIYSVRVNGGFDVPEAEPPCTGDGCLDDPPDAPEDAEPGSEGIGSGNPVVSDERCAGLARKAGKARAKARRLTKKAKRAKPSQRRKQIKRKAGKQKRKAKRFEGRASACRGGSR